MEGVRRQHRPLTYVPAGLGDEEQALVAEALHALGDLGPPVGAYLGGSRAFGLGNALSDVDLTVVFEDAVAATAQRERSVPGREIALHCQVVAVGELAPLTHLFKRPALPADSASIAAEVVVSSHRKVTELLRGPVVRTSPAFEALRGALDPGSVDALSAASAAMLGALSVRDAAGAARSGDWLTAAAAAQIALEYALDAALFAAGDPYRSRKFLPRRLERHPALAAFLDGVRRAGGAHDERRTRETLLVANGLQAATLLAADPATGRVTDGGGPRRSPYVTLVATDAGLLLAGETECGVGRPAAALWLLADGRPGLARRFAEAHGLDEAAAAAFVETNVASLAAAGALDRQEAAIRK